ncbi:MAG: TldD/PmbA family protein [Candidatus Bathyarchaeota archaeon]|nr:TldD/PmbA family protein [Candidatus Bathyarchaeota archaeon]MDH5787704.1 TldD/PmbA family protein [Candidatus Bathyarchaeota archaeon]
MKDELTRIIDSGQKLGAEYVEVRAQRLFRTVITSKDSRIEVVRKGIENGAAIRVLVNGAWGFASNGTLEPKQLMDSVSEACRMAKAASLRVKEPAKLADIKTIEARVTIKPKANPKEVPTEKKINMLLAEDKIIFDCDKNVKSCTINYLDISGTNYFANSDKTYIEQDKLYLYLSTVVWAREADKLALGSDVVGYTTGFEVFETETPEKIGRRAAMRSLDQLKAKTPKGGTYPAIIGPQIIGVFAHEAFGHLAEADLTLAGSVLIDKLGKKVGSEIVNIVDDGTIEGAIGTYKYDDEGVPAQKTPLIKNGEIVGLMHNRETAQKYGTKPTGNARAEDFRYEPIIRQRNTYFTKGDRSFEEMLEDIKLGYYIKNYRGGQANLDGTFQVGVQEAHEIVNGELGASVRNVSFSGNTLETLYRVDAVGKDFELNVGVCGKGQAAFCGAGGPHTRVKEVLIGGGA